ncbi:OmpA family protein [Lutimaribacter marinistellae]|uniref:OmpA family protein n=1 Tax=Lutimaribacter marinistellae TaxID=1820329 RepID=A0ABV7TC30_9RHOB
MPEGARLLSERISPLESYNLPVEAFDGETVPSRRFEGRVERFTWRLQAGSATTLQILSPLRERLAAQGWDVVLDCAARACGGFDFRFSTEVVPAPDMYVAIRDYRFLSATRTGEALSLLISRDVPDIYIQMIHVLPVDTLPSQPLAPSRPRAAEAEQSELLAGGFENTGRLVLEDLEFRTGADELGEGPFPSLSVLTEMLALNPDLYVVLVGHTDTVGDLDDNIALSQRRAEAVRNRLVETYGAAADRITARGVGYLAPRATNASDEGRRANRRVEAVVIAN